MLPPPYRGRLAPSPTGYLHLGHAATFLTAQTRAREQQGILVLRIENLDGERCKPAFADALVEDMRWVGLLWQEGPDVGGPFGPYRQTERIPFYFAAWNELASAGAIYPCSCTRRDVAHAVQAPHAGDQDSIHLCACCENYSRSAEVEMPDGVNWRFRVPDGDTISFVDGAAGPQTFIAGRDFGDFIIWRKDGTPAYQLAVVVDDAGMKITEVVRGADLLSSTAQQILIYRALGLAPPAFYHCPLVTDRTGKRLAKRTGAHSLRALREAGADPAKILSE